MRIPEDKIEEIRQATDIVELIGGLVPGLKKRGKNYLACCPFHAEKTPSFNVSPERQSYKCFGCGASGTAITFLMEQQKLGFPEAIRLLAKRAGISLPEEDEATDPRQKQIEQLLTVNKLVARFFYDQLRTPEGRVALDYFDKRGIRTETIKRFGLGYAPDSFDALARFGREQHIPEIALVELGLLKTPDDGSRRREPYDRFRGRAMFPIFSPAGRVIGFGGRILTDDKKTAKYINSPESSVYHKSDVLYGLSHGKESIRGAAEVLLVEGYTDVISLHQAGVTNVVASSGTALTEQQIRLVGRYAKGVVLVYDGDSAGSKATLRGLELVVEAGLEVQILTLPEGEDPDSFVRSVGADGFAERRAKSSLSFIDFKLDFFKAQGKLDTPEDQADATRSVIDTVALMPDPVKREFYARDIARKLELSQSLIDRELERALARHAQQAARPSIKRPVIAQENNATDAGSAAGESRPSAPPDLGDEPAPRSNEPPPWADHPTERIDETLPTAEQHLIKLMLDGTADATESVIDFVFTHLTLDDFTHRHLRSVAELIYRVFFDEGRDVTPALVDQIEDRGTQSVARKLLADPTMQADERSVSDAWRKMGGVMEVPDRGDLVISAVRDLQVRRLEAEESKVVAIIKNFQDRGAGESEEMLGFLRQKTRLRRAIISLRGHKTVLDPTILPGLLAP